MDHYSKNYAIPPPNTLKKSIPVDQQEWEGLKRQAKQVEFELDSKLASYGRLNISNTGTVLSFAEKQQLINSLSNEIDMKLSELYQLVEQMGRFLDAMESSQQSQTTTTTYKQHIQRHRDLYHDYMREYQRTKSALAQSASSASRVSSIGEMGGDLDNPPSASDFLLDERAKISSSTRRADQVIEMAFAARESLHTQRMTLVGASGKTGWINRGLEQARGLISKISLRKRRDKYIMAGLVVFCMIILFLYSFRH